MKLQYAIFKTLNNPKEVQTTQDKVVEIHSMNETKYLAKFAGKGQFAVWTSDSKSYKLLIEDGYYETMKDLYGKRVNLVWINFYEKADKIRFGLMYKMVFPMIGLAMVLAILFSTIEPLQKYQSMALIGILAIVLITNMAQTSIMRKKIEVARTESIKDIKMIVGADDFQKLLDNQQKYYDTYFKFEEKEEANTEASPSDENNK
ncbi:MAG: hypothetical protein RBQ91_04790 [Acholeplasma sp.]|nr:hypothetical protein [Acholeplasma sp.]